jgi:glycosyltransferase involved in cell wall biosynthesis
MRIAFDGRAFDSPAGGVRRYISELTTALQSVAPAIDLAAIGGRSAPASMAHSPASSIVPTNLGWSAVGLPLAARRQRFDVFHAPAYTAPLWGVRPLVVTIHDVSYARRPEWSPHPGGVGAARQWFYRKSARAATRIVTDSSFSKDEIVAAYAIAPDYIDVVPLGVSSTFSPDPATARAHVVLHVGDLHPRRNLMMLLDAVIALKQRHPALSDLRLVLAGRDLGVLKELRRRARESGAPDVLHHAGQPADAELLHWYRSCGVLAYPSKYEGFGLPVIEAMAAGAPVVASGAASIPEVAGDAAMLISPDDPRDWIGALERVLLDDDRAKDLSARGPRRASMFGWDRTARLTLDVYERAIRVSGGAPSRP